MRRDRLMVVGAGEAQIAGIACAQRMGFEVVAVDGDSSAPGLSIAEHPVVADIRDAKAIIELAKNNSISGVCAFSVEAAVRAVAAVAHALGLPGPSIEAARNATDKNRMRKRWAAAGIPSPTSCPCLNVEDVERAALEIGLPVVVKPADSAGSRGVSLVTEAKQLAAAYESARMNALGGVVLVEFFMPGVEMSVEGFMVGGKFHALATSDKIRTNPPYLLDTTVLFPSEHSTDLVSRAIDLVARAATALELDVAPVHAEVMVTPAGPMMVELAARGPGFRVFTTMLPWVTGIDGAAELIRLSTGSSVSFDRIKSRGAVLRFPEVRPGRVQRITGLEAAKRTPGVVEVEIYCKIGDRVRPLTSGADRIGHIIALADTRAAAATAVRTAEEQLEVVTEPE